MPRSAGGLRSPRPLRHPPIDPFQKIGQLRWRDRHRPIGGRWPDEAASFQSLRKQTHALAVVPQNLDQPAAAAAEDKQMATMWIALELLLHHEREPVKALAHIRVAGGQPNPNIGLQRDHHRELATKAAIVADRVAASTAPLIRSRVPRANSISIVPMGTADATPAGAIVTAANLEPLPVRSHSSRRHRYNWLV